VGGQQNHEQPHAEDELASINIAVAPEARDAEFAKELTRR
jgi:ribosomal protein S18 acetylase RimI-like enzyme